MPETHLRWELAALWVSRVCTRLLPGTEIAFSGKGGGAGEGGQSPWELCGVGYPCLGPFSFFTLTQRKRPSAVDAEGVSAHERWQGALVPSGRHLLL